MHLLELHTPIYVQAHAYKHMHISALAFVHPQVQKVGKAWNYRGIPLHTNVHVNTFSPHILSRGCSSVVERLLCMQEALGSIPSTSNCFLLAILCRYSYLFANFFTCSVSAAQILEILLAPSFEPVVVTS